MRWRSKRLVQDEPGNRTRTRRLRDRPACIGLPMLVGDVFKRLPSDYGRGTIEPSELTEARMFPVHICPDITAFVGTRRNGMLYEGVVDVLQGPRPYRQQVVWPMLRASERQALLDARKAARRLVAQWRDQVPLPRGLTG